MYIYLHTPKNKIRTQSTCIQNAMYLTHTQTRTHNGTLSLLDVESLFTNVPVKETIDIVIQGINKHSLF